MHAHIQTTLNPLPSNKTGDACGSSSFQYSHTLCAWTVLMLYHLTQAGAFRSTQHFLGCFLLTGAHTASWCRAPKWHNGIVPPCYAREQLLFYQTPYWLCQGSTSEYSRCWLCSDVAPSSLWLSLFQGFIAIWDWFPALHCLYPITRGSDCCQMVSLHVNCLDKFCVLRGGRISKKNLVVYFLYEPLEILHRVCSNIPLVALNLWRYD